MNKSIEKLRNFLKELSFGLGGIALNTFIQSRNNEITKEEVLNSAMELSKISIALSTMERVTRPGAVNEVFDDFAILSEMLIAAKLKESDNLNILMYFIKRNLNIEDNNYEAINMYILQDFNFKTFSKIELDKYIADGTIRILISTPDEELSERQRRQKKEILDNKDKFIINYKSVIDDSKIIEEHYKKDITEEDIRVILKTFKKMEVEDEILESINTALYRQMEKHQAKIEKETVSNIRTEKKVGSKQPSKKYLTDKEYKDMKKSVRQVYDAYNMQLLKAVTYEEMIHIVSLMLQINMNEYEIIRFISLAYQEMEETVPSYEDTIEKLKFYYNCEQLETLNSYYEEVKNSIGEDNNFWQNEYLKELRTLTTAIPNGYKYEIEEARKKILLAL